MYTDAHALKREPLLAGLTNKRQGRSPAFQIEGKKEHD